MKVYIDHNFAARAWLAAEVVPKLQAAGHEVTSSWITDDSHLFEKHSRESAVEGLQNIEEASSFIIFAEQYSDRHGTGKFVELGYAIRAGKRCIVIGEGSCIFYHLPTIRHAKDLDEAIRLL